MFRILLRNTLYFARKARKGKQLTTSDQINEEQSTFKPRNIKDQYQNIKQMFDNMDKNDGKISEEDSKFDLSLEFIQKMIKEDRMKEKIQIKEKKEVKLEDKLRKLGTPQHLIKKNDSIQAENSTQQNQNKQIKQLAEALVIQSEMKSVAQIDQKLNKDLKLAQQELLLDQIMKKSKEKEVKLDINIEKKPDNERQYEQRLILRRQKIIESLQKKSNPADAKLNLTTQDLLAMKYSPEILSKAHEYKNNELRYFKQLINNEDMQNNRNSPFNERYYKDQIDEKKYLQQLSKFQSDPEESLQNSYKTLKQEEGLKLYEDQQFYKSKAIRQIKEKATLTQQDLKLKEELNKDLELGQKVSDVFLDEVAYPNEAKIDRRIIYSETSFARQDNQIRELNKRLEKLGIQFDQQQIKSLSKQLLFQQKHFLEEQQGFQKYLQRKQKKKNMKKQLKEIHKNTLRDDLDFDKQQEPIMSVKQVQQASDTSLLEDNYQRLQQYEARKLAVLVDITPQEKQSEVHRKKTFKNMYNFITLYFANGLFNHNHNQMEDIEILQIIPNKSNTVMNIFWNFSKKYLTNLGIVPGSSDYKEKFQKQKKKLAERLKNQSMYISGKMTQLLRLRYGPQIRFYYDQKTQKTTEAIQELSKYTKEIAMVELEQYTKKGFIKSQEQEIEYYEKLLNVAKQKLQQFNSRKQILSKTYQRFHKVEEKAQNSTKKNETDKKVEPKKKKRVNPIHQTQQKQIPKNVRSDVHRKKKPSQKLWDSIDLL